MRESHLAYRPYELAELGRLDLQLRLWAGEYGEAGSWRCARAVPCCTVISTTEAHRARTGDAAAGDAPRPSDPGRPLPQYSYALTRE